MTDNKIYPGGGTVECAKKTPLVDLLRGVPKSDRAIVQHDEFSTSYIPIGAMCHNAADEIERLHKQIDFYQKQEMEAHKDCDRITTQRDELLAALEKIACRTQSDNLLWWQVEARAAIAKVKEGEK